MLYVNKTWKKKLPAESCLSNMLSVLMMGGGGQNPQCSFHENNMSSSRQYKSLSQSVSSSCFSITLIFFVSLASVSLLRECGRWKFNRERLTESEWIKEDVCYSRWCDDWVSSERLWRLDCSGAKEIPPWRPDTGGGGSCWLCIGW